MQSFAEARRMMVDGQIRTNDVTDGRILAAFGEVPREQFVPAAQQPLAYLDRDLPVTVAEPGKPERCLLKPMVLARLIYAARIDARDRVLDVACATGYSSAVLARLAGSVVALEQDPLLAEAARNSLSALGIDSVTVRTGALTEGAVADAPFDVILVNGAIERLPEALGAQLADGGRLVCVQRRGPPGKGMMFQASGGVLSARPLFDAGAPLLPGFVEPPAFVF